MSNGYSAEACKPGLGCVTFGREINEEDSFAIMDHAYQAGINFFDTAAAYGAGASEAIIGKWLSQRNIPKGEITVATKILPPYHADHIRLAVDASLARLQRESIDILYLHQWNDSLNLPEAWAELDKLVKQGKVKALGVSNFTAAQLTIAVNLLKSINAASLRYLQNNHNLAVREVTKGIKQICRENDINIVTFSPLGAGFLTGKHQQQVQQNSRFELIPGHQGIYFNAESQKRLERLLQVAEHTGYSPVQLALSWTMHQPGTAYVLIGGRKIEHIDQALAAQKLNLPQIFAELDEY